MQKIKVSRVESRPTQKGGTMVAVFDEKNTRFSGFLKELLDIREGDSVEADIQVDGRYNNITAIRSIQHPSMSQSAIVSGSKESAPASETEIAARIAGQLLAAKIVQPESPLGRATMAWCLARLRGVGDHQSSPTSSKN